jgi:hypothetical protein
MRYSILWIFCVVFCLGWTECTDMPIGPITPGSPVAVTPDANPAPYTSIQTVTASMPVIGADMQALALQLMNQSNASVVFAAIGTISGYSDGAWIRVDGMGHYRRSAASALSVLSPWVIASADGGKWVHESVALHNLNRLPAIGPVPGETYAVATTENRLNRSIIEHGYHAHLAWGLTRAAAFVGTGPADPLPVGTEIFGQALGPVQAGDIIEAQITATVKCAVTFVIGSFATQDNGVTHELKTPNASGTAPTVYAASVGSTYQTVALSFTHVVDGSPVPSFAGLSVRGYSIDGTTPMDVCFGAGIARITRP